MSNWWRTAVVGLRKTTAASRSYHTIEAVPREISGRRVSVKERNQGRIPAVVESSQYDPSAGDSAPERGYFRKQLLTVERRQIQSILKSIKLPYFYSTIFPMQIRAGEGSSRILESGNVLPTQVHSDLETGNIYNLQFVWANEGTILKAFVPVEFKGEDVCPGIKKGGMLIKERTILKYKCPSEHIPQKIEVDISKLDIGDKLLMRDVKVHPSMELICNNDLLSVCRIAATLDTKK